MKEFIRKNAKTIIACLICLILAELAVSYYLIEQFRAKYITRQEALYAAISDAHLGAEDAFDTDVDFEHEKGRAWYEVSFEDFAGNEYEYRINAENGAVLSSRIDW